MKSFNGVYILVAALFVGTLVLMEVGRRIRLLQLARDRENAGAGVGVVEGALFALLGLLIAFTFSGAASRFDDRRHLVIEEANDIGTAWLRLDLLPPEAQPALRDLFRQYLDSRLATYRHGVNRATAQAELARTQQLQNEIWKQAVAASHEAGSPAAMLLLPALNAMIDITTTRTMATQIHPPPIVFAMLVALTLAGALFSGYGMAENQRRSWIHIVGFAAIMTLTVYVILDIEYPRVGLIRVDAVDQVLVELRKGMEQ